MFIGSVDYTKDKIAGTTYTSPQNQTAASTIQFLTQQSQNMLANRIPYSPTPINWFGNANSNSYAQQLTIKWLAWAKINLGAANLKNPILPPGVNAPGTEAPVNFAPTKK